MAISSKVLHQPAQPCPVCTYAATCTLACNCSNRVMAWGAWCRRTACRASQTCGSRNAEPKHASPLQHKALQHAGKQELGTTLRAGCRTIRRAWQTCGGCASLNPNP